MLIQVDNILCKVGIGGKDLAVVPGLEKELSKYFEVPYPDQRHIKEKKNFKGEMTRKFYKYGSLATGLLPYLVKYAESKGLEVILEDHRTNNLQFREDFRDTYGEKTLLGHQKELVLSVKKNINGLPYYRGIWDSCTNSGKTLTCMALLDNLQGAKALFIVDKEEHIISSKGKGAYYEFCPFLDTGIIKSRQFKVGKDITIAMIKTLLNHVRKLQNPQDFLGQFNVLFVDECHKSGGKEYKELLLEVPASVRVFVSGTPLEVDDMKKMDIIAQSGPVLKVVTNKEMIEAGVSALPLVSFHAVTYTAREQMESFGPYETVREKFLYKSETRCKLIGEICKDRQHKQILIPFFEKQHGYFMLEYLRSILDVNVDIVHGTDPQRAYKLDAFIASDINVLLSSTILKEGVNIPNIEVMINAIAGKSVITLKQFLGRELRKMEGKDTVEFHDFYDDITYLDKHSRERIKIFQKEGLDIQFTYPTVSKTNFRPKTDFKKL